ncbi:MAG TPA: glycosyltransferase [Opitutaceae bacterium]|nr:glycosyltransferase [Opitutaceae bacterium]
MTTPLISVVMPVYNAERYLRQAVESILAQSLADFELIAVDDGSKDNSRKLLEQIGARDPRVHVISRPNTGIVGALNDGLAVAKGQFIARMDADDVALPHRFAEQIAYFADHPDCVALGTAVQIIDAAGRVVDRHAPAVTHAEIESELLLGNGGALYHPTAMFRVEAVRKVNGYDPNFCKAEDVDLYLRLSRVGQLANLPTIGLQYRHHLKSTNFLHRKTQSELITKLLARERALRNLPLIEVPLGGHSDLPLGRLHARWACTALAHGTRGTAIHHALAGIFQGFTDRECWRALAYVLTARPPGTA